MFKVSEHGLPGPWTWHESLSSASNCGPDCFRPTDSVHEGELKARTVRRVALGAAYTTCRVGHHRRQRSVSIPHCDIKYPIKRKGLVWLWASDCDHASLFGACSSSPDPMALICPQRCFSGRHWRGSPEYLALSQLVGATHTQQNPHLFPSACHTASMEIDKAWSS